MPRPRPKPAPGADTPSVRLPTTVVEALRAACAATWPRETCGLLLGAVDAGVIAIVAAYPARNLADAADRFEVDPRDILEADAAARSLGVEIVGVWHSHPTAAAPRAADAAPSALDAEAAWAGWRWLIAAIGPGGELVLRAWRWEGGRSFETAILSDGGKHESTAGTYRRIARHDP
jgi:proteasome lid subunit RPN8/RPN11